MSKVLAVNCGSSSLKFQLFEMDTESVITSGIIERIGMEDSIFTIKYNGTKDKKVFAVPTHKEAVQVLLDTLIEKDLKLSDIKKDKTLNNWYKNHLTIFKELIFDLKGL